MNEKEKELLEIFDDYCGFIYKSLGHPTCLENLPDNLKNFLEENPDRGFSGTDAMRYLYLFSRAISYEFKKIYPNKEDNKEPNYRLQDLYSKWARRFHQKWYCPVNKVNKT